MPWLFKRLELAVDQARRHVVAAAVRDAVDRQFVRDFQQHDAQRRYACAQVLAVAALQRGTRQYWSWGWRRGLRVRGDCEAVEPARTVRIVERDTGAHFCDAFRRMILVALD